MSEQPNEEKKPLEFKIPAIKNAFESMRITEEVWKLGNSPQLIDVIINDLNKRIKRDIPCKLSVFFAGISAYLQEPINVTFRGESGCGKSYNVTETLKYFPSQDVWLLIAMSPKTLVHQQGVTVFEENGRLIPLGDKPYKPRTEEFQGGKNSEEYKTAGNNYRSELQQWRERRKRAFSLINLKNKIIVFLQPPYQETLNMLYPILSHDTLRHEYRYVNPDTLMSEKVVLEGYPASILLSAQSKSLWELSTRCFTVTPEISTDKIAEVNELRNQQIYLPWNYTEDTEEGKNIKGLLQIIKREISSRQLNVITPYIFWHLFPTKIIRDMRDFNHLTQLIHSVTMLHLLQRPVVEKDKKYFVVSSIDDVIFSLYLFSMVFETTRTGTIENVLEFYRNIVSQKSEWTIQDLTEEYNLTVKVPVGSHRIRSWIKRLQQIGYVDSKKGFDKREYLYSPIKKGEEKIVEDVEKLKDQTILRQELEKSLKNWIEIDVNNRKVRVWGISKDGILVLDEDNGTFLERLTKNYLSQNKIFYQRFLSDFNTVKEEKLPEIVEKTGKERISTISKDEFVEGICSVCGEKTMVKGGICSKCEKETEGTVIKELPKLPEGQTTLPDSTPQIETPSKKVCCWCKKDILPKDTYKELDGGNFIHNRCSDERTAQWLKERLKIKGDEARGGKK